VPGSRDGRDDADRQRPGPGGPPMITPRTEDLRGLPGNDVVRTRGAEILDRVFRFQSLFGLVAVFAVAIVASPRRNGELIFLSPGNLGNIVRAVSEIGIIAIGMTFVILIGGIDLSVGAILGLAAVGTAALLVDNGLGIAETVIIVMLIGLAIGVLQGLAVARLGSQAVIATLAGLQVARGLARIWSGGVGIPIAYGDGPEEAPPAFSVLSGSLNGILPVPAVIFAGFGVIAVLVLRYTAF